MKHKPLSIERLAALPEEELDDPRQAGSSLRHKPVKLLVPMLMRM